MLFSSIIFIFYFLPVVLLVYYACFWSKKVQNFWLFLMSLLFYAWGEPGYVLLILALILLNYAAGRLIHKAVSKARTVLFVISISGNLFVLFVFKYMNFFLQALNDNLDGRLVIPLAPLVLPIGISFFTFQAISYLADVYRNQVMPQKNLITLGLYISFFPQLIAGPIVQYKSIEEQMIHRKESYIKFSKGSTRFILGLSKKLLIANQMAVMADRIFDFQSVHDIPLTLAWLGAIAYTLQIYYDFSGYSDMAIGLARMFGFHLEENFDYPYISVSVSDFWRRWHISLGRWFRDYVYIPLGGSRTNNLDLLVRNILVVWLLTGIWHGDNWTFWIWGIYNGLIIVVEKYWNRNQIKGDRVLRHIYTMLVVMIGWVMFRSQDLVQAGRYIANLFSLRLGINSPMADMLVRENALFLFFGILFSMPVAGRIRAYMENRRYTLIFDAIYPVMILFLFLICICYMVKGTYNPFIYFNF